ncbi:transporter, major facilitator family protein [Teladorsagia circumcincta]|uniref:Transporter, major facilitator family protein n=1 Tax=Teladorsagia circumcincta TaxID=45464 RepID=A0A2G9UA34_TELCI|nr:transporter, major facilitator family protein [Teladorsagia circumcincta]
MFSVLVGAMVSGQLSDRYGRKPVLIISIIGMGLFSLATALSVTFLQFNILRAIIGIFTGGLSSVFGVYLIENIPKHHRMWINTIVTWSPNFIIYPIIAYFCHDWRKLALFCFVISVVTIINLLCVHESPRWLIQHGRIEEARRVLTNIRHLNGKTCEKEATEIEEMLRFEQEAGESNVDKNKERASKQTFEAKLKKRKHYTFYHLVCTWKYIRWSITVCSGLIFASLVNYGLLFNMEKLSGSLYWNNTMFGLYIAKFMITTELFPTAIRNIASSALAVSSRFGTIIAPQLFYLADISPVLPYFVLLTVSIIDCICFQVILPETKGRNLENHLPPKEERIFNRQPRVLEE